MKNFRNYGRRAQGGFAWIPAAISAVAGLVGGKLSQKGAEDRNVAQIAQSDKQMAFQKEMSNTAHQREVKDLRAAGLNPILSGTGGAGASSPGGAQAQIQDELTPAVSTAMQALKIHQELKSMKASEMLALTGAEANTARAALTEAQTSVIKPAAKIGEDVEELMQGLTTGTIRLPGLPGGEGSLFNAFKARLASLLGGASSAFRSAQTRAGQNTGVRVQNPRTGKWIRADEHSERIPTRGGR